MIKNKIRLEGTLITMFRNPLDRIISSFLYPQGGMITSKTNKSQKKINKRTNRKNS
jgi:hypothetical protein